MCHIESMTCAELDLDLYQQLLLMWKMILVKQHSVSQAQVWKDKSFSFAKSHELGLEAIVGLIDFVHEDA